MHEALHVLTLAEVAVRRSDQRILKLTRAQIERMERYSRSASIDGFKQLALLRYVHALLLEGAEVLLVGDSEFGSVPILRQLERWHWRYVLRQKGRLLVCVTQDFPRRGWAIGSAFPA